MTMTEPTPNERHLRDILNATLVRLRAMQGREVSMPELKREAARIADMIQSRVNQKAKEEA